MKRLPLNPPVIRMIQIITRKRMTNIFHMHPDLMRPPGFQMKLCQRIISANRQPFIMRHRRLPGFKIHFPGDH